MNVSAVIRKYQRLFGDSDFVLTTQTDVFDWIDEAQLRIVRDTHVLTGNNTSAASTYYPTGKTLPADWIMTKRVTYGTSPSVQVLRKIDIEDLDSLNINPIDPADSPSFFYIFAGTIRLYPLLSSTDIISVSHDYVKMPTAIASTATPLDVPISFHEDIVRFCIMRAHERNENWRAMEESSNAFEGALGLRKEEGTVLDDSYYVIRADPDEEIYGYNIW